MEDTAKQKRKKKQHLKKINERQREEKNVAKDQQIDTSIETK